jgi:hypothetical protein
VADSLTFVKKISSGWVVESGCQGLGQAASGTALVGSLQTESTFPAPACTMTPIRTLSRHTSLPAPTLLPTTKPAQHMLAM